MAKRQENITNDRKIKLLKWEYLLLRNVTFCLFTPENIVVWFPVASKECALRRWIKSPLISIIPSVSMPPWSIMELVVKSPSTLSLSCSFVIDIAPLSIIRSPFTWQLCPLRSSIPPPITRSPSNSMSSSNTNPWTPPDS